MATRQEHSRVGSFSRGAELWMHQARLFFIAVLTLALIAVVCGLTVTGTYFWQATTPNEKYALERHWIAHLRDALSMTAGKMELSVNGVLYKMEVKQVVQWTETMAAEARRKLRNGGLFGLLTAMGVMFLVSLYWFGYGKKKMTDKILRGARLVTAKELIRLIQLRHDASPYFLAGVPMRQNAETLHTLIGGAQGTGKSQQFFALIETGARVWQAHDCL